MFLLDTLCHAFVILESKAMDSQFFLRIISTVVGRSLIWYPTLVTLCQTIQLCKIYIF